MVVRWPGKVPSAETNDTPWYFADFLPTAAAIAGTDVPTNLDGIDVLPTLLGKHQTEHSDRFLYWGVSSKRPTTKLSAGKNWKAVRMSPDEGLELYDLLQDPSESNCVADEDSNVVERIEKYLRDVRTESQHWPSPIGDPPQETR